MRYKEYKHETETRHSSLFVFSFLAVFLCAAALGSLRLYGLYLEHRISETTRRIERIREENTALSKSYSELLSPARVYNYARTNLGMDNAGDISVIKVDDEKIMLARAKENVAEESAGFFKSLNPFVKEAHAKD